MTSPVHGRMARNLQPFLVSKTLYQLTQERELPDSFTDIVTPQSQPVPRLPPKKWKVCIMKTVSLWFTFMIGDARLESHYYEEWVINDAHPRAAATLRVLFNVFFYVYVMVPFMTMLFGHWLKRTASEQEVLEPWRTLNDGLPIGGKLFVT
jgi:antibiotic biosynthesis monooxygenase (ABM) superfamily enzyme